jgi:release factor glutamine methyltransferase
VLVDTVIAELWERQVEEDHCLRPTPVVREVAQSSQAARPVRSEGQSPRSPRSPRPLRPKRVLDLCTGTGCIALSLLHECSDVQVVATDIDTAAIESIRENASELGLDGEERLVIFQDDLACSLLADKTNWGTFDVVVSNPPYIPTAELEKLPNEIAHYEPRKALDGGKDGLDVFRRIVEQARLLLVPNGLLACELHEETLGQAQGICEEAGFSDILVHPDLTGRPRIITAHHPIPVNPTEPSL